MPSSFLCPITQLHLEHTLACGQAFRWRLDRTGWWSCLLPGQEAGFVLVRLWQDREQIWYETSAGRRGLAFVRNYLRMDVDLPRLSREWTHADPTLRPILTDFAGLRVLRQDPEECLFSFLCTPAAPLYRIRAGITALCREYGDPFPGGDVGGLTHHAFPSAARLAEASVPAMMHFGLGFRAKNVREAARQVVANGGAAWLHSLRFASYADAKAALMSLPGVGEKIADCVCLFSLDKDDAVPGDTHVRQAVQARYGLAHDGGRKTFGPKQYAAVGDTLRARFGQYAGWASQYLFYGDLYERGAWGQWAAQWQAPPPVPVRPVR